VIGVAHSSYRTIRWLLVAIVSIDPAHGAASSLAEDGWQALVVAYSGWTALAGLGLIAVAIAARYVGRPRSERAGVAAADSEASPASSDESLPAPVVNDTRVDLPDEDKPVQPVQSRDVAVARELPHAVKAAPAVAAKSTSASYAGSELFLALHHVDLSIDVLHRHLLRQARPMPAVWLMLLDLARTHGREQTFRKLAREFHRRFNVCTPRWDSFPPGRDEPGLEAYPRLVKEITLSWGTHECRRLIDRLLFDNRGGSRRGFTLNAYNDLIALKRACDAVLDTIEQDLAEEAKLRSGFATPARQIDAADAEPRAASGRSPLVSDLECELDADLRGTGEPQSALEREHPALVRMLTREWSNASLVGRLCEVVARGGHGDGTISGDAAEELELLRRLAQRIAEKNERAKQADAPA
jgi:hypothetical protein